MTLRNTTPVPNRFFDELMQDFSSSAVRVYLKIVRNTNGWRDENGHPKKRDWISHSQFSKVGVSSRSVTSAIEELLSKGLIILTDDYGNLLHNPQQRKRAQRIYYALITQDKAKFTETNERNYKRQPQNLRTTKDISIPKYKVNERMPDNVRFQQILMHEELKQNKRDNWS